MRINTKNAEMQLMDIKLKVGNILSDDNFKITEGGQVHYNGSFYPIKDLKNHFSSELLEIIQGIEGLTPPLSGSAREVFKRQLIESEQILQKKLVDVKKVLAFNKLKLGGNNLTTSTKIQVLESKINILQQLVSFFNQESKEIAKETTTMPEDDKLKFNLSQKELALYFLAHQDIKLIGNKPESLKEFMVKNCQYYKPTEGIHVNTNKGTISKDFSNAKNFKRDESYEDAIQNLISQLNLLISKLKSYTHAELNKTKEERKKSKS